MAGQGTQQGHDSYGVIYGQRKTSWSTAIKRPQCISSIKVTSTLLLNLINCKTFTILHHPYCCYVYIPGTTCLHIPLAHPCLYYYLSPQYTVLHILFCCTFYSLFFIIFYYLYLFTLSCVVLHILHCPLSGPDLTYILLLIIFCIIEYVTNTKKT